MWLTIVRHARAGNKRNWTGPDEVRPLDALGEAQAEALVVLLAANPVSRIVSSPTRRCLQTVEPLAAAVGVPIEECDQLGPDAPAANLVACFGDAAFADAVLCTHGEVMRPLLRTMNLRQVMGANPVPHRTRLVTKGTAWRLRLSTSGRIVRLHHLVPAVEPLAGER